MAAFEAFCRTRVPAHLQEGAPPPDTWPFGPEAWESFREATAKLYRIEARRDFLAEFTQGWTLREVLGDREYRQETYADGRPKRPLPSDVSPELERQARYALGAASSRGLQLDALTAFHLERAVDSSPSKVAAAVAEVQALCNAHDFEKRAAQSDGVWINVLRTFTGPGHIEYPLGRQQVTPEQLQGLRKWQEHTENLAAQGARGLEAVGEIGTWPPFGLEPA
jgi:hypothetical protein